MEIVIDKSPELMIEAEEAPLGATVVSTLTDKAPELPVKTENIRKSSISVTDFNILQPPEVHPENASTKSTCMPRKGSADLCPDAKSESNIKRVDSYSKFGVMETVPLEIVPGETATVASENVEALEKTEKLSLQLRSLSMNENISQSELQNDTFQGKPHSASDCETNVLSKYFNLNNETRNDVNADGIAFFNALAENSKDEKLNPESFINSAVKDTSESDIKIQNLANQTETGFKSYEGDSAAKVTTEEVQQPILLKFFAEDKSGTDKDGKLFFDKIAEEKSLADNVLDKIKDTSLTLNSIESNFLGSPSLNSEAEEAWIPSEKTRQVLVSIITSVTFIPDQTLLTMPGVILDEELEDPVKALLIECNSPESRLRKVLTVNDVSEDENGLKKLIEAECYNAAVNLTKRLLKTHGQGPGDDGKPSKNTPFTLRLWHTRLALLVKLRKFSLAEIESAAFGDLDRPDLYYEFYPDLYEGKRGSMVPFSFRLLLAELPQYLGNHQVALDNMYSVLNIVQKIIKNVKNGCAEDGSMINMSESRRKASLDIWCNREQRVLYSILNGVLAQKDFVLAVSVAKTLIEKSENKIPELHSALGRIYLQLGDVQYAQDCFTTATTISQDPQFAVEDNINKALLAVALNNSEEAYKYYQHAYALCPDNAMLANNMAVCLLYMGRLKESLTLLEETIYSNPASCLHDGILFNTCTLYELESSLCTQKKISMLELVSKYAGDSFNVSCLKIQLVSKA
ncbi:trafficking protein particle complex subunit 12-like [Uloborus diversus]|uniref:trafficking protein particle complex subunit 12-like n=1 Tax=Uloborus diversus TaxID=327109 RepID=UPI00240A5434|nr:trafficking protein particle complex subunit 12-like [Uloborus diversus]